MQAPPGKKINVPTGEIPSFVALWWHRAWCYNFEFRASKFATEHFSAALDLEISVADFETRSVGLFKSDLVICYY